MNYTLFHFVYYLFFEESTYLFDFQIAWMHVLHIAIRYRNNWLPTRLVTEPTHASICFIMKRKSLMRYWLLRSRRGLVKNDSDGGPQMASSAYNITFSRIARRRDSAIPTKSDEKVIWSACTVNCGSRCPLRMHVVDGEIKYVETDNTGDDNYDGLHRCAPVCVVVPCVAAFTIPTA